MIHRSHVCSLNLKGRMTSKTRPKCEGNKHCLEREEASHHVERCESKDSLSDEHTGQRGGERSWMLLDAR